MTTNNTSSADTWSADLYRKYEAERNRPVVDLLNRIITTEVKSAADIGCGPGNSTQLLQEKFPKATVVGMDSSPNMIEAARKRLPDIAFEVADVANWQNSTSFDVILSNAVLQWVPNHHTLIPNLLEKINAGGTLAIQMPDNFAEPTHRLMREVAASGHWAKQLTDAPKRLDRQPADWYFNLLYPRVSALDIWRTTYFHPIKNGAEGIVEMVKSTGLRPYLDTLAPKDQDLFLEAYQAEISKAYKAQSDGTVLLPYPRLFIIAVK
ncbi:trans-aconitate 2-methyltransferase [Mucilaginibacter sp. RS28]|uniref:Trans-aconitate 2-methyltransferase n=1 Tax=Mucilaginibacter straminoryzae TaxID=2932774 RepID=A0A9X1X7S2_9SPHI|nr:trans-aconitate 2-methyltransferase [Mucilaginibacter straminoryzae]MCJ8210169.1 trans-aconitate 2-methyltransferase [Mucilaginibacter straminoryzae]